jgi:acetyltransferase-like isoleucine patch superfamily enzyme
MTCLHLAGKLPSHRLRIAALRRWGADIDPSAIFYHGFEVRNAAGLSVGPRVSIGNDAILDARGGITIGSDVNFSTGVSLWTGQHDWQSPTFAYVKAPIVIGDHAWLSTRVTVLPGVTIGEGAVIAAGAVVTKDVAPHTLMGGVPAKPLGTRPGPMSYELPGAQDKPWWW